MPSGCKAMMRLDFNQTEQCLIITQLNYQHKNHNISQNIYSRLCSKTQNEKSTEQIINSKIFFFIINYY